MATTGEIKLSDTASIRVEATDEALAIHTDAATHHIHTLTHKTTPISPFSILNDERIARDKIYVLPALPEADNLTLWAILRAMWHVFSRREYIAIERPSAPIHTYLTQTGLGFGSPVDEAVVILARESFWQGAGAPETYDWLRRENDSSTPNAPSRHVFPQIQSFTKNELVATVHPLRPPKPTPGSVFYTRYVPAIGQTISFVHMDGSNATHFEHYKRWQNSDRVNTGWRERGSDEKHHKYIADRLADKHMMGFLFAWDGNLAGYGELAWVMEDPINVYCGGMLPFDQGIHLLVGEEHFRGKERFIATVTSMMHFCFLREPRTQNVVVEPRADLGLVPRLASLLPIEMNREFEFPHKRAVFFRQHRQRFFQAASLE
ncbi:hypothetical protein E3P81_02442 [Wallemia ichthyophaga]|nr:hypothetical protein E3P97_02565 [Wallemia ichthyophaga]TIB31671.1 hypothetical protein E3P85_02166 [Wallemia ichthyophaga]TIB46052.1 hypothetical protein E3P82_02442 [Wallemia ichthyophaga]TIB49771.1 hypothetical protein E3P81_02442 [Wallemia ichthyophaga]TIB52851.1 hypothetical protein E3P80_02443 [Wallemia ichthyophaga]